jgi:hypothetical protein
MIFIRKSSLCMIEVAQGIGRPNSKWNVFPFIVRLTSTRQEKLS